MRVIMKPICEISVVFITVVIDRLHVSSEISAWLPHDEFASNLQDFNPWYFCLLNSGKIGLIS